MPFVSNRPLGYELIRCLEDQASVPVLLAFLNFKTVSFLGFGSASAVLEIELQPELDNPGVHCG